MFFISPLPATLCAISAASLGYYLSKVNKRLIGPHSLDEVLSDEELAASRESWRKIDMLKAIPSRCTCEGYVVIGGSGFVGSYIVQLLLLRKETSIRIIDANPPAAAVLSNPSVSFVKVDITSRQALREALQAPFALTGKPANVVYHTAAVIRFWERAEYCKDATWAVNVEGTRNVLEIVKELPGQPILVYTSTADLCLAEPDSWFSLRRSATKVPVYSDNTSPGSFHESRMYTRSKYAAEQLVIAADKASTSVKHGIIRPGYAIVGLNDPMIHQLIRSGPQVPFFDGGWASTAVAVWDVAAAHLLMEDALRERPQEVRADPFLVTGKCEPWSYAKMRNTLKILCEPPLELVALPPLAMLLTAHAVEIMLWTRYHSLATVFAILRMKHKPALVPKWLGQTRNLQPAMMTYMREFILDDSRARKVLGYRPQWTVAEVIHEVVTLDRLQRGTAL